MLLRKSKLTLATLRHFGLSKNPLDVPTDVLIPNVVREIHLAIQTWEKQAVIKDIIFTGQAPHLTMSIVWQVADSVKGEIYKSEFIL